MQVEKVEVIVDGTATHRFHTGDDVRIRLHYRATSKVPRPVFEVRVETIAGVTVTAPSTRDIGLLPDCVTGVGTVEVDLRRIALLPGTYDLHTAITDFSRQHEYDHVARAARFDVTTGRPYESGGLVSLHPSWTIN